MPVTLSRASGKSLVEAEAPKRILLCEGYDDSLVIEAAYVVQGKKVWQAFGESVAVASLCESDQGMTLVESFEGLDLVEDGNGGKKLNGGSWIVEGPAQRSDVKNKNGRSYPRAIWEKWIGKTDSPLQETIKARGAIGHLEHPKDGRTDGREGSLVVTEATLKKDGVVWCKFEVLDTPHGKIIQEYIKKKVRWGVSSRGAGTVNESGVVSIIDYVPETWDAVMRPSTPGAYPLPEQTKPVPAKKAVSEGEKTTDVPAKTGASMTDVQKVYKDRLNAINRKVETVDECAVAATEAEKVLTDLAESITKGELDAASGTPLMVESASALREAFDALAAMKVIEQAGDGVQAGTGAFNTVVAMLKKQIAEAVSEVGSLQAKVEQAEAVAERMSDARSKAVDQLEASGVMVESLKGRLDAACATISDLSESTVTSPVNEAVDLLITRYPVLKDYAATLRETADIQAVVEGVVPILLREGRASVPQKPSKTAVPVGMLMESEAVPVSPSKSVTVVSPSYSAQVGLVAAMVGKPAGQKQ